jgi:hypothetical protein
MKRSERGACEPDGARASLGAKSAKLGVLLADALGRGRVLEQLTGQVGRERDERNARVRGRDGGELEEPSDLRASRRWWRADDDGRAGLDDEAAHREREGSRIARRERARARDLPGVEGCIFDGVGRRQEREDARVAARGFSFEHRDRVRAS